jgi:hypothetical protein
MKEGCFEDFSARRLFLSIFLHTFAAAKQHGALDNEQ